MKKKSGFTLAEVLITLGIIGVVAALTAPALVQNAANAKVGPTLAKVVSTIENANQKMMVDEEVSVLSSLSSTDQTNYSTADKDKMKKYTEAKNNTILTYLGKLSKHIAGSSYESTAIQDSDVSTPVTYYDGSAAAINNSYITFHFSDSIDILFANYSSESKITKGSFKGQFNSIMVDINGLKTGPNCIGKDLFWFSIDNNGKILADGSKTKNWAYGNNTTNDTWDNDNSNYACNANKVSKYGYGCSGSIFDNNLKVIYQ